MELTAELKYVSRHNGFMSGQAMQEALLPRLIRVQYSRVTLSGGDLSQHFIPYFSLSGLQVSSLLYFIALYARLFLPSYALYSFVS